jgi:hypothetical protein
MPSGLPSSSRNVKVSRRTIQSIDCGQRQGTANTFTTALGASWAPGPLRCWGSLSISTNASVSKSQVRIRR